jgi:hypothetical protein
MLKEGKESLVEEHPAIEKAESEARERKEQEQAEKEIKERVRIIQGATLEQGVEIWKKLMELDMVESMVEKSVWLTPEEREKEKEKARKLRKELGLPPKEEAEL